METYFCFFSIYTCVSSLQEHDEESSGNSLTNMVFVKENLSCRQPVELAYYSCNPEICIHRGSSAELIKDMDRTDINFTACDKSKVVRLKRKQISGEWLTKKKIDEIFPTPLSPQFAYVCFIVFCWTDKLLGRTYFSPPRSHFFCYFHVFHVFVYVVLKPFQLNQEIYYITHTNFFSLFAHVMI